MDLPEAIRTYVSSVDDDEQADIQHGIHSFIRWCGRDVKLNDINPPELGEYSEALGAIHTDESRRKLAILRGFLTYVNKNGITKTNLAKHIKIKRSNSSVANPKSAGGHHSEAKLTEEGYSRLTSRLDWLTTEQEKVAKDIQKAASDKDVRENAPLEASRQEMGRVVSQMAEIETILSNAVVMKKNTNTQNIAEGSNVVLKNLSGTAEVHYVLVDPSEASPLENKISTLSPVGKALLNHNAGDKVKITAPSGNTSYLIVRVS